MFLKTVRPAMFAATIWLFAASAPADEFADGMAAFDRGDFSAAHQQLMLLAERDDARAAIVVAGDFYVGWGVPANDAKAEEWRVRAKSIASPADFGPLITRWRSMAAAGDAAAQVMLGSAYYAGFGLPMDSSEAVKWIRAAAEQGHVRGQFALAELYLAGDGVSRDVPEAIKWLRLAAGQGDASAQLRLEMLNETGLVPGRDARGESEDDSRTLERYRLAAAGQSPLAQMRLGEIYLRGDIVPQDAVEAYQWLVLASTSAVRLPPAQRSELQALLGWAAAMLTDSQEREALHSLGVRCRDGTGVPQDDVLADRFMGMAAQGETTDSLAERPATAPRMLAGGDDCLYVIVRPSLQKAVRVAAETVPPPPVIRFEGDPGAELCKRSLELSFSVTVDRSRQSKNWEDTEDADTDAIVIGSMLPWPCPTTHTLFAVVRDRAGEQLDSFESSKLEDRTGTMLRCADESGPSDAIATQLVRRVLRRMTNSATAPVGVGGP
jgi:TPR repeat protein